MKTILILTSLLLLSCGAETKNYAVESLKCVHYRAFTSCESINMSCVHDNYTNIMDCTWKLSEN